MLREALLLSVALAATAAPPAQAADAPAKNTVDEVVVTAQRREERLQDVPIAITSVGAATIEQHNVSDLSDLRGLVPGLSVSGAVGANVSNLVVVRGLGGLPVAIGASQATAVYLDGVYLSRPDAAFFGLDDVERVEVLRGPQGTLYGRNATAGAINIITREPSEVATGRVSVSYGNYNDLQARGSVSGPLGGGFSAGLSGAWSSRDGYFVNVVTGHRLGDRDSGTIRGKLRYESADSRFNAEVSVDYSSTRGHEIYRTLLSNGAYIGIGDPKFAASDREGGTHYNTDNYGAALTLNYTVNDNLVLTSVTSARTLKIDSAYDSDGTASPILFITGSNKSDTFFQEFRVAYTSTAFRFAGGVNYYREQADFVVAVNPPAPPLISRSPADSTTVRAAAVFGQAEYDIHPKVTLVGGLRFNSEKRDYFVDYSRAFPTPGLSGGGKLSGDVWLPSLGVNFKPDTDTLIYAKVSKGYQSPGFDFSPGAGSISQTFGPETLWAYEGGAKLQLLDRKVTFNAAAFYYDYKDIQVRTTVMVGVNRVLNAARASVKGAEFETSVRPLTGLTFNANLTYLDARYDSFPCDILAGGNPQANDPLGGPQCGSGSAVDRSGNVLNQAPKWAGSVSANYSMPLTGEMRLTGNLSYAFESRVFYSQSNELVASNPNGWERLDARLALKLNSATELYVYGANLTDNRFLTYAVRAAPTIAFGLLSDPRTYGVGARLEF